MGKSVLTIAVCTLPLLLGFMAADANPGESSEEVSCPSGWEQLHRGCYMFVETEMSWSDALNHCTMQNGELTSIQSWKEKEELNTYLRSSKTSTLKWWVGLQRGSSPSSDWKWLQDYPLDSNLIPWSNPRLRTRPGNVCGMIDISSSKFQVSNDRCTAEHPFICEYHNITNRTAIASTTPEIPEIFPTTVKQVSSHPQTEGLTGSGTSDAPKTRVTVASSITTTTVLSTSDLSLPQAETSPKVDKITAETSTKADKITSETSTKADKITTETSTKADKITSETSTKADKITTETSTKADKITAETSMKADKITAETSTKADKITAETSTKADKITAETSTKADKTTTEQSSTTELPTSATTTAETETTENQRSSTESTSPGLVTTSTEIIDTTTQDSRTTHIVTTSQRSTTTESTTPIPTQPRTAPETPRPTTVDWAKAFEKFSGCYIPGTGGSIRDTVKAASGFYAEGRTSCPEVQIGGVLYPTTAAGKTAEANCTRGNGFAKFHCSIDPLCWKGQPDISDCASKNLRELLRKVNKLPDSETTVPPPTIEESIAVSSTLVEVTQKEETTMEDVFATSKVITALTQIADGEDVTDKEQVQAIVDNVVKAGSNLVSVNKSAMWEGMSGEDKVRSASTLLVAMETATVAMAEEINQPTVITQKDENIELELRVVDMSTLEKEEKKELVYDSKESENTFSIPVETLKSVSKGGLAKAVFMTHYSMSDILGGRSKKRVPPSSRKPTSPATAGSENKFPVAKEEEEEEEEEEVKDKGEEEQKGPRIASYILSASLGVDAPITKLPKPVTFTMKHIEEIDARYFPLCSFWNVSQETRLGFWSQEGCRVLHTNATHTTCACDHLTNFAILLDVHGLSVSSTHESLLRLVTIIGCIISCFSLLASWITFQCFTSLQGERNSIHKNLVFTLLAAEILFVFGIEQVKHQVVCSVIAGCLHFLFLAAFMWMFIEGLHIIFMLVQVFDASRSRLPYYYLTGYGVPLVVVGASCLFYYKGYGTDKFCWLTTDRYFIWAFAGPVAIILLVNAFFLTYAMSTVCRHSDYVFSTKEKASAGGIRAWVQGALALEVLLGLTWTLGYFLITEESLPLAYIFAVMNSLQGLFIFLFHCLLNKKAQKEYRQIARKVAKRSPSSATTHSTFTRRTNHTNHSHEVNHSPNGSHQKLNVHSNSHSMA